MRQEQFDRNRRQHALLKLLDNQAFTNQSEVVLEMRRIGYQVTQPSVSRDFRELGIVKIDGRYARAPRSEPELVDNTGAELVKQFRPAGAHLLVIRTAPGAASVVAFRVDQMKLDGVIGTVAGDDTVFIATTGAKAQRKLLTRLRLRGPQ